MMMMKRLFFGLAIAGMVAFGIGSSESASVSKIFGAAANGPAPLVPLTPAILCQSPSLCARIIAPDWSDSNSETFYGTDGTDCRKSIDGAVTWADCGANPSATATYLQYAVTRNGTVLAAGNDGGGSVFRVRRSTDGAASWSTAYDSAPVDLRTTVANGRLRCAQDIDLCTYIGGTSVGNQLFGLVSTTDGATWVLTNPISATGNVAGWLTAAMLNDGSLYYVSPSSGDGFSSNRSVTFDTANWVQNATLWPTTAGGSCNWAFFLAGAPRTICHETGTGTTYTMRDAQGATITTFSLPDVPSDSGGPQVGLAFSVTDQSIHLVRADTTGRTGLWVSVDSGVSFVKLFATDPAGQGISSQGSTFKGVDGCIYFAYLTTLGGTTSTIFKVCL